MAKCVTAWLEEPGLFRAREKGIGSGSLGERVKKKAGFFIRILVFKSPEIQINPLAPFFRCIMTDSNIENLDDEELLMYYETTKKLLENKMQEGESQNGKIKILQQKLEYIEDELKSRSLWEAE